ncbi:hypothetical protein C874_07105 [Elizabethkingia anophelis 502]|nr:hypothetical protein C874_07105 [Elizabethkingia anophelis 502]
MHNTKALIIIKKLMLFKAQNKNLRFIISTAILFITR